MDRVRITRSEAETVELAAALGRELRGGEIIALAGELGAGKTCFVRGLADGLGLDAKMVNSPTFTLMQMYEKRDSEREQLRPVTPPISLIHIDAYRLSGPEELETLGWEELLRRGDAVIAVEWPERIAAALPAKHLRVEIEHLHERERRIRIAKNEQAVSGADSACRTCAAPITSQAATFPFCSDRCRLVDLGNWFEPQRAGYVISRPIASDEELSE